jgi:hypothetical protein
MKNNKNIHVVETDYYSRLAFNIEEGKYIYKKDQFRYNNQEKIENRDIYITSDGFITENSWICHDSTLITTAKEVEEIDSEWKLVVLTTDVDLIKDGVQAIDDEFLEWFVKNPSCEFVEVKPLLSNNGRALFGYKIIIPKEEPKQHVEFINNNIDQLDKAIESFKQETLEEVRKVERTELFNSIFSVVKQIPRKDVDGDAMDAPSCAYEIEQLFYKWQQEQDKKNQNLDKILQKIEEIKIMINVR